MGPEPSDCRPKRHPSASPEAPNKKRPPVGQEASQANPEDAITRDEIQGAGPASDNSNSGKVRNACRLIFRYLPTAS